MFPSTSSVRQLSASWATSFSFSLCFGKATNLRNLFSSRKCHTFLSKGFNLFHIVGALRIFESERKTLQTSTPSLGSLRIDDFRTTTPLNCVTGLLRMLIWAVAVVAPKSTPLLTAIRRRPRKSRT